ncbi:MAG: sulfite exporter TauE/SafE family protein [Candidatus Nanopelagicales bacterium]|nr:sulfite exporter TauE/SafE family protein [Candidatus Nanopelagicales bacterium]
MDFLTVTLFALVGAAAQFVDGLLGMGFGITSASLLTVLGYSAVAASAGTHAAKVGTTLVSGVSHWREGNVDWRVLITVGVPGAVGAFIGAVVLTNIALDGARIWMAAILFLLGLTIIARFGYGKSLFPAMKLRTRNLWPIGLFGGFVDATGGGGWGPVATPSLMTVTRHKPHRIVGTVSASEFLVAASASIGFLFGAGEAGVPWLAVLGLVIGGVITAPIAARLAKKAPTAPLGVAVGGMVLMANTAVIASVLEIPGAISAAIVAVELLITIAIVIQVVKRTPAPT